MCKECRSCAECARYTADRERIKLRKAAHWRSNKERLSAISSAYQRANLDKYRAYNAKHYAAHPEKYRARWAKYAAGKIQATPAWANSEEINWLYALASALHMDVDHIVPLRNKLVCGLHCEFNLQLLTAAQNRSKGNRFAVDG